MASVTEDMKFKNGTWCRAGVHMAMVLNDLLHGGGGGDHCAERTFLAHSGPLVGWV